MVSGTHGAPWQLVYQYLCVGSPSKLLLLLSPHENRETENEKLNSLLFKIRLSNSFTI